MSTSNDIAELLRKGIEAARDNKRNEAREFFEQVVELDEKNEKGWFWLASVVDSDDERRICLSNVLHINPSNERAKRAMDALQVKAKEKKPTPAAEEEEVVAGVSRRQMTLIIGVGGAAVILILIIALVVIIGNNNRQIAENATAIAVAQLATQSIETATAGAIQATGTSEAATATQLALATPVPPTRIVPTLPPTWTPTPEVTQVESSVAALPLPVNLTGKLAVWGGQDMLAVGYLPLGYFDFDLGMRYSQIGNSLGKNIGFSFNGERVTYTVYDLLLYSSSLEEINLNGTQKRSLAELYTGQNIFEPQQPSYGPLSQSVTFIAHTDQRQTTQVFLLDLTAQPGTNPVRQLTDDDTIYTYPVISPDGTKIAAVRNDPNAATPLVDIVNIDVATGGKIAITNDGGSYAETSPHWTRDGSQIVFAAAPSNDPNNSDIYIKNSNGSGSALPLYRDPANDIFPVLSPDGRYLAFASNRNGEYDIFILDQQDGTLSQLTNTPEDEYPGDWWQPR